MNQDIKWSMFTKKKITYIILYHTKKHYILIQWTYLHQNLL
jgi:hypothetical protein